ncbi:MAG TPA: zinc-binding alcohol dehydrogenase family protein [Polyangia bacterium]|jgi:NADPH:quinone reductase-like Zn-dependent oxidoreductase|nr:zinc-binding alcohol dehydrogenase family protein [Polyangia bacterium]
MYAAVVRDFTAPPRYEDLAIPPPAGPDDVWVDVLAAGLHPRVRAGASGAHYADERVLPMVPVIDAVGRLADGTLVYCVVHDTPFGTMAARVVADRRRCAPLPAGADAAAIAAAMNPAMSAWIALRLRARLQPGQSVFVLGATGNAGQMAIQIARLLGAGRVVGAGRDGDRLASSGADEAISLVGDPASVGAHLAKAASESDVVLDYLWGEPAAHAMVALLTGRKERARPLDWVQIGSVAGPTMSLPSVALRSTNLRVMGSGQGSVPLEHIVAELPRIADAIAAGKIAVDARRVPLADVEKAWTAPTPAGQRIVFVP